VLQQEPVQERLLVQELERLLVQELEQLLAQELEPLLVQELERRERQRLVLIQSWELLICLYRNQ
jgi:hypothetical protein